MAETRSVFIEHLSSPFGMALVSNELFAANTNALVTVGYQDGDTHARGAVTKIADLPGGPRNLHWTKGLVASADGSKLYVSVSSNCNVAKHGMAHEAGRASVWVFDHESGQGRIYASGPLNRVGMACRGNTLWTAVNERDGLGSDLVPDYLSSAPDGAFYGWPYSDFGQHVDARPIRRSPTWWPQPSAPTTRWATMPRRWVRPRPKATQWMGPSPRLACSSASMVHGTASLPAPTRSSTCASTMRRRERPVKRPAPWGACGHIDRFAQSRRQGLGSAGRVSGGQDRRAVGGRRWGQHDLVCGRDGVGADGITCGRSVQADLLARAQALPETASGNYERLAWITKSKQVSASSSP